MRCPHCNEVIFKESHKTEDCGLKDSEYDFSKKKDIYDM